MGICARTRELARSGPVPRRSIPGKVNFFITIYSMNKQGEPYIYKTLTETLLYQTITMDTSPTDTTTNSCTEILTSTKEGY